jgi:hypothetical protein
MKSKNNELVGMLETFQDYGIVKIETPIMLSRLHEKPFEFPRK